MNSAMRQVTARLKVSNGDVGLEGVPDVKHARCNTGNTHGSIIELNGKYFVFYHRHSNRKQSSRQAMAEEIRFEDGKFYQAEMTSCGLNGGPLEGKAIRHTLPAIFMEKKVLVS